jgi:hypothetical protein
MSQYERYVIRSEDGWARFIVTKEFAMEMVAKCEGEFRDIEFKTVRTKRVFQFTSGGGVSLKLGAVIEVMYVKGDYLMPLESSLKQPGFFSKLFGRRNSA